MSEKMARRAIAVLRSEIGQPSTLSEGQLTPLCQSPTLEEVLLARFLRLVSLFERQDQALGPMLSATCELTPPSLETGLAGLDYGSQVSLSSGELPLAADLRQPVLEPLRSLPLGGLSRPFEEAFADFLSLTRLPGISVH